MVGDFDFPYVGAVHRWWHLSTPPPELRAAEADGWLGAPGTVVDLGCGLGVEAGYLAGRGWQAIGVDLSRAALRVATTRNAGATFVQADVLRLPVASQRVDLLLDRGCLHYLDADTRDQYVAEARRVLRPDGRLLLRTCLYTAGVRNDVTEGMLRPLFADWQIDSLDAETLASDTRRMPALLARLVMR